MAGINPTRACRDDWRLQLLQQVFAGCFEDSHNTVLVGGAAEPLYQPARQQGELHQLYYRADYLASALHEAAHWCIAGAARRKLVDFGYWYAPDGRCKAQQLAFERVEYQPQALEWILSRACRHPFRVSIDNLDSNEELDTRAFQRRILRQARDWQRTGLPARANTLYVALAAAFGQASDLAAIELQAAELDL